MLGKAWNELPGGNLVSYKLSFKKGMPQVPEAKPTPTAGESLATQVVGQALRQSQAQEDEQLE